MIQNFRPGGLARTGSTPRRCARRNPRVVYASISGFGAGGGAHVPGYDLMVQAVSGLMSLTGEADGPPFRAGISVFDVMAGNHAVIGILAALRHRDATGEGQHVEVNLLSSALSGPGQPQLRVRGGRRGALPDGQRAPERLPVRAAAHGRPRPDRRRGQRRPVPQAVRRARHPRGGRRPAVPAQRRPHGQPGRAAPILVERLADPRRGGVVRAARRRRGAVRADQHDRRRFRDGREVRAGAGRPGRGGRAGAADGAAPDHVLRPRPRATRCRRRSWTSTAQQLRSLAR